jgi:hypothetical protein
VVVEVVEEPALVHMPVAEVVEEAYSRLLDIQLLLALLLRLL